MVMTMTERQEVARRLREAGERLDKEAPSSLTGTACITLFELLESAGIRDANSYSDVFSRLANLIDPTCRIIYVDESYNTPDTGRVDGWHYECSRCRYELSDGEMDELESGALPFSYCPNCGARVVNEDAKKHC